MVDMYESEDIEKPSLVGRVFSWLVARPLLTGLIAGIFAFIIIALAVPADETQIQSETVTVTVTASQAAPVENAKPMQETNEPPPADVPVVAEVAVLITDVGLNRRVSEAVDRLLPRDVSLAISSYATDPVGTAAAFKTSGRDVWLQMAAQSVQSGIDPGPLAISGGLSTKENMDLIKRQIGMGGGNAIGIYIPNDADITAESDMWRTIAMELIGENQMILDGTSAKVATELYVQKSEAQISAYLKGDKVIDGDVGPAAIQKALTDVLPTILNERQAIIIVTQPTVLAIDHVSGWIKGLAAKGIRLVPASRFTGLKP